MSLEIQKETTKRNADVCRSG